MDAFAVVTRFPAVVATSVSPASLIATVLFPDPTVMVKVLFAGVPSTVSTLPVSTGATASFTPFHVDRFHNVLRVT